MSKPYDKRSYRNNIQSSRAAQGVTDQQVQQSKNARAAGRNAARRSERARVEGARLSEWRARPPSMQLRSLNARLGHNAGATRQRGRILAAFAEAMELRLARRASDIVEQLKDADDMPRAMEALEASATRNSGLTGSKR